MADSHNITHTSLRQDPSLIGGGLGFFTVMILPRKGFFFVLAQEIAWSLPSVPLIPKPPGTRMPL